MQITQIPVNDSSNKGPPICDMLLEFAIKYVLS